MRNVTRLIVINRKRSMRFSAVLTAALLGLSSAHASPPCQEMADKVAKKFDAQQKMSKVDMAARCRAISLIILDLQDLAVACGADQKFIDKTYMPLAKAISDEAPKDCPR